MNLFPPLFTGYFWRQSRLKPSTFSSLCWARWDVCCQVNPWNSPWFCTAALVQTGQPQFCVLPFQCPLPGCDKSPERGFPQPPSTRWIIWGDLGWFGMIFPKQARDCSLEMAANPAAVSMAAHRWFHRWAAPGLTTNQNKSAQTLLPPLPAFGDPLLPAANLRLCPLSSQRLLWDPKPKFPQVLFTCLVRQHHFWSLIPC